MDTGSRTASVELSTGHGDLGIEVGCDTYFRTVRVFYSDISYPRGVFFAVGTYLPCLALPCLALPCLTASRTSPTAGQDFLCGDIPRCKAASDVYCRETSEQV
jgi:hypothetical protein